MRLSANFAIYFPQNVQKIMILIHAQQKQYKQCIMFSASNN